MIYRRYYGIADLTIQLESDIPIRDKTFDQAVKYFEIAEPGLEMVTISHHFSLPEMNIADMGQELYRRPPWAIYRKGNSWIYLSIVSASAEPYQISVFNEDHSRGHIYNSSDNFFSIGGHNSLCLYPSDQVLIARILADRAGFYLHSAGVIYNGQGLLFAGHSGAGKSTLVKMLAGKAEILCDDRIILRKQNGSWRIYGTWSHGEIPDVSPSSAPLKAIFFLEKASGNNIIPIDDRTGKFAGLLECVIKSFADAGWWSKTLSCVEDVSINIPCYRLLFDRSGRVLPLIENLVNQDIEINK